MRHLKFLSIMLLLLVGSGADALGASPSLLGRVTAPAAIIVEYPSNTVLFARNPDLPLPPASTTKVLTAYVALRSGRLASSLPVSRYASSMQPSKIGLKPGWSMNVHDLVYAILLNSANDASVVLAEGLAGSVPEFAHVMNRTAWRLGARNSHFVNPSGLTSDGHYSTARDLIAIMRAALAVEPLEQILSTREAHISPQGGSRRNIVLRSHNRMLDDDRTRVIGKTGYTRAAKKCFVGLASQGDRNVLVAVLGSMDLWGDLRRMVDWAFDNPEDPSLEKDDPYRQREADWQRAAASPPGFTVRGSKPRAGGNSVKATKGGSRYHVQVASFRTRAEADRLRRKVASLGYRARVEPKPIARKRSVYRVTVPNFSSRASAFKAAQKLRRTYRVSPSVIAVRA